MPLNYLSLFNWCNFYICFFIFTSFFSCSSFAYFWMLLYCQTCTSSGEGILERENPTLCDEDSAEISVTKQLESNLELL